MMKVSLSPNMCTYIINVTVSHTPSLLFIYTSKKLKKTKGVTESINLTMKTRKEVCLHECICFNSRLGCLIELKSHASFVLLPFKPSPLLYSIEDHDHDEEEEGGVTSHDEDEEGGEFIQL